MHTTESPNILIVDDYPVNLELLRGILEPQEYRVTCVTRGNQALAIAKAQPPDLFLLDVMLPGMDGFELCTHLKKTQVLQDIPVIFVTARTDMQDLAKGFELGGVDYITKPLHHLEVLARVKTHLHIRLLSQEREETVTRLSTLAHALKTHEARLQAVVDNVEEGIFTCSAEGIIDTVNPQLARMTGYAPTELLGSHFFQLLSAPFAERYQTILSELHSSGSVSRTESHEMEGVCKNGDQYWLSFLFRRIHPEWHLYMGVMRDISLEKRHQKALQQLSETDALTKIANRRKFDRVLGQEWQRALRHNHSLSLILIDIDHFKRFNDTYGHPAGDLCLQKVAKAMQEELKRPGDLLARYGGEEFAIILPETDIEGAYELAQMMRLRTESLALNTQNIKALHSAQTEKNQTDITISLGIAEIQAGTNLPAEYLVKAADQALYQAKTLGRNRVIRGHCCEKVELS